jgi:hypothetical protein
MLAMIAVLNLLSMGAGGPVSPLVSIGRQSSVLEACSSVDVEYRDLGVRTNRSSGFQGYGTVEQKYRRTFTLHYAGAHASILNWIDIDYRANVAAGGVPFSWLRPKTSTEIQVRYKAPPSLQHSGPQGGNAATVTLEEVFQTD